MSKVSFILFEFIVILSLLVIPFELKKEQEVNSLMNYVIVLDPGHGGKDNGCSYQDVVEDDINLAIAKYLFEELQRNNFIVYLTRDGDYDLADEYSLNRKNEDLINRVKIINNYGADILISLHINYYQNEKINGPMVYHRINDEASKKLANQIQENLNLFTDKNKIIHGEDFYLFRKTSCLALLIECGFISNKEERERLISPNYQMMLSKQIRQGIISYLNER